MMPNFLIIGAAKCGTTTLYHSLKQHPQIYMSPVKETNFFAFEGEKPRFTGVKINGSTKSYQKELITDIDSYRRQFRNVNLEIAIGESCPSYLYIPKAASNIKRHIPQVKLIVILRDPIERAYSNFLHHVRERTEYYDSFLQAIESESWRIKNGWWWGFHYIQASLYYEQIKRYLNLFDRNQIKFYLFKELKDNFESLLGDIYQFLEIESISTHSRLETYNYNSTGIPANQFLDGLIRESNPVKRIYQTLIPNKSIRKQITNKINCLNPLKKPYLTKDVREELLPRFRDDICQLQDLIDKDISSWLT